MSYTFSNSPTPDAPLSATSTESEISAYSARSSMNNTDSQTLHQDPKLSNGTTWNGLNGFNQQPFQQQQRQQFGQQSQLIPPSHPGAMPNMRHHNQPANQALLMQQQRSQQTGMPQNMAELQNLQNKMMAHNYNQQQQRMMAQQQQQQLFGGAAGGAIAGLTPYQQQQAMIQMQHQQQQQQHQQQQQQQVQQQQQQQAQQLQQQQHQQQQQQQHQQQMMAAAQRHMQQQQLQAQQHQQATMNGLGQQIGRPSTAQNHQQPHHQPPSHQQQHPQHGMGINPQMMFNNSQSQPSHSAASPPAQSSTPAPVPPSPALSTSSLARGGGGGGLQRAQSTSGLGMGVGVGSPGVGASAGGQMPQQQILTPQHSGMEGARAGSMGPWQNGVDGRSGSRPPQGGAGGAPPVPQQRQSTGPVAAPLQPQMSGGAGGGSQIHGTPRMGHPGMQNGAGVGLGVGGVGMMQNGNSGVVIPQQHQHHISPIAGSGPLAPPQTPQQTRLVHPAGGIPPPPPAQQQQQQPPQQQQRPPGLPPNIPMPNPQQILSSLPPAHQKALLAMPPQKQKEQMLNLQMQWMRQMQAARENEMNASKGIVNPIAGGGGGAGPAGAGVLQTPPRQSNTIIPPPPMRAVNNGNAVVPPVTPTSANGATGPVPIPPIAHGTGIGSVLPPHIQAKLDHRTTQITPLPLLSSPSDITHSGALPELSDKELDEIVQWMAKDKKYISLVDDEERRKRIGREVQEGVIGRAKWWENEPGGTVVQGGGKFDVVWPAARRKWREERRGRKEVRFPMEYKVEQSGTPEVLVPVRIDLEFEHYRLRDTFVWNMHDPVVTPEQFALATCQDFDLPLSAAPLIGKLIQEQLAEFKSLTHPSNDRGDGDRSGLLKEEEDDWVWWDGWRKKLQLGEAGEYVGVPTSEETSQPESKVAVVEEVKMEGVKQEDEAVEVIDVDKVQDDQVPERAVTPHEELRIMIKLDILVGSKHLVDQFEWDTNDTTNSPELFAEVYASDLGLGGEFKTAIAHDIREQVHMYQRSLVVIGHRFDGSLIQDEELRTALLPPVTTSNAARSTDAAASSMPIFNALSDGEMENNEKEREKDMKRKKRQARGRRGVVLPDREPVKTNRTLVGTADISSSMPPPALASVPSRRAAAVTATQTIASLVAQENNNGYIVPPGLGGSIPLSHAGTPTRDISNPPSSSQHAGRSSKRQKTGHLIRAPDVPESVLGKRAKLGASSATTSSTGVEPPPRPPGYVRPGEEEDPNDSSPGRSKLVGWHCSTCGCPDAIAIGRRKGPKGDKSQCGPCGKYYHRYRRIKDVEFNPDPEHHLKLKEEEEDRKKRKRPAKKAVVVNEEPSASATPAADIPSPVAAPEEDEDDDDDDGPPLAQTLVNAQPSPRPRLQIRSPDSSPSPPLASARQPASRSPAVDGKAKPLTPSPSIPSTQLVAPVTPPPNLAPPLPSRNRDAPEWMNQCIDELQAKYENDRFGAILRPLQPGMSADAPREWRIKCFDCPGKVYTPGPDETLSNFEVHLKNKRHRDNVNGRLTRERGGGS